MSTGISDRELVSLVPLAEMIDFLSLKRRGRSFQCPNSTAHKHGDQTPSAYIHSTGASWSCYSCNIGGTIVNLVAAARTISKDSARLALYDYADIASSATEGRFPAARQVFRHSPFPSPPPPPPPPPPADPSVHHYLHITQAALQESLALPAHTYLAGRGIPLTLAIKTGIGFAPPGEWPNLRGSGQPRLIAPLTTPDGILLNLYGRSTIDCHKSLRHDFLEGPKGLFNAITLTAPTVVLTEAVFDALTVLAAGYPAAALCGLSLRDEWWPLITSQRIIIAFDADHAGQARTAALLERTATHHEQLFPLPPNTLSPHKDLNEYWIRNRALPPALLALLQSST